MKIAVSVSTSPETVYSEAKGITTLLNKADENKQSQSISLNFVDFNYGGSIKPLADLITDWINKHMEVK